MTNDFSKTRDQHVGQEMFDLAATLFPICRSVTGPGVRQTLTRLQQLIPLEIHEVPSGTQVFDWRVPREWDIRNAYIKDEHGNSVVEFHDSNLHVVNGSVPIGQKMSWSDLKPHLHTLPDQPTLVPYRTCFHTEDWGFCLRHEQFRQLESLGNRMYEVCIDSNFEDGSLTYGELLLPGESSDEVLVSTHTCHPSLANDNLSGMVVATYLARTLLERDRRLSYRFLFIPATIGAITWLSLNREQVKQVKHGWVLSGVGDRGPVTYKKSRHGDAAVDRTFEFVLRQTDTESAILDFEPFGYDQRQFCSPGFNLPVGNLMRSPNGTYPEYHTSADNLAFIQPSALAETLAVCLDVSEVLEGNRTYVNLNPKCEPCLGPRGLYHAFGSRPDRALLQKALLWVLNLSDGNHGLLDIAERAKLEFRLIREAADLLVQHDLLTAASTVPFSISLGGTEEKYDEYCLFR
jgi:aminopeptidase-like protein